MESESTDCIETKCAICAEDVVNNLKRENPLSSMIALSYVDFEEISLVVASIVERVESENSLLSVIELSRYPNELVNHFKVLSIQLDVEAQFIVAWCYWNGVGVIKDVAESVKYYNLAAAQGHSKSQFQLGYYYEYGIGVMQDINKAYEYYELSGYPKALNYLGKCYRNGTNGVEKVH